MREPTSVIMLAATLVACATSRPIAQQAQTQPSTEEVPLEQESAKHLQQAIAPKEFVTVPPPDASAAQVPNGYRVEVVLKDLTYPTSVEFDDEGNVYVAEAGYAYGDLVAPARVTRIGLKGQISILADQLNGPVNGLLWNGGRLYVSHRGKISAVESDGSVRDLVTGLPTFGDHHNNALAAGPDGKIYFGQGTATNSGVVGLDNVYPFLWLAFYPDVRDVPARDLELAGKTFTTPDALMVLSHSGELVRFLQSAKHLITPKSPLLVKTGAFQPFGKSADKVKGEVKANGTILRMNADGTGLEQYAWGLRNPFGLRFSPDGKLYAIDLGFDERGSRPIANAPDAIWVVREGGWYGWPDYVAGEPVTDTKYRSSRGEAPSFLLKTHPPVEKPVAVRPAHSSAMKFDFSRSERFGFVGQMFVADFGGGAPVTGPDRSRVGYDVSRIDLSTGRAEMFLETRQSALGPKGHSYSQTAGPKHPIDVRFSRDGEALYVVDFGAMEGFAAGAGPAVHPFPGTGVVRRITRDGSAAKGPPANLSVLAGRSSK